MANKYAPGAVHLILFDKHGSAQKTIQHTNFLEAETQGDELTAKPPYASYVITKVLKNSTQNAFPWELSPEEIQRVQEFMEANAEAEVKDE